MCVHRYVSTPDTMHVILPVARQPPNHPTNLVDSRSELTKIHIATWEVSYLAEFARYVLHMHT